MNPIVVNSESLLQTTLGQIRTAWAEHHYLKIKWTSGKARSLDQNAITHAWYEQLARELPEDDATGWKSYCKLHHGVPILRAEDEDFRTTYDSAIKGMSYEKKLQVMRLLPVTSLMTKKQIKAYAEEMQKDFAKRNVVLAYPEGEQ